MRLAPYYLFGVVLGCLCHLSFPQESQAKWHYSAGYQYGYTYYGSHYAGSTYYAPGYYYYEREPVTITYYYQREYVPVAFSTYQPAAVSTYQTAPLAAVASLATVTPPAQVQGSVQVNTVQTQVRQGAVAAALAPPPPQPVVTQDSELLILLRRMDARLTALEASKGTLSAQPKERVEAPAKKQSMLTLKCAGCHHEKLASNKLADNTLLGGGIALFKDVVTQTTDAGTVSETRPAMTAKQITKATFQVLKGKMPKLKPGDAKLEDGEGQALLAELENLAPSPEKKGE